MVMISNEFSETETEDLGEGWVLEVTWCREDGTQSVYPTARRGAVEVEFDGEELEIYHDHGSFTTVPWSVVLRLREVYVEYLRDCANRGS